MFLLAFAESSIQLFPDGTLFIHIALILFMIWVLNRTFFRPINRVIESRARHSYKGGEAEEILQKAAEKQAEYDRGMLAARNEGYKLIEEAHAAAITDRSQKVNAAKEETANRLHTETRNLDEQAAAAREALAREAEQLAERISSTILKA